MSTKNLNNYKFFLHKQEYKAFSYTQEYKTKKK